MGERFTLSSGSVLRCQWRERSALSSGEKATPFTVTATTIFLPTEDPWRTGRALGLAHAAAVGRAMLQTVSQSGQRRHSHSRSASVPVKTFSLRISYFFANVFRWIASRGDSLTTHAIILTDSVSLPQKVKSAMESPDRNVSMVDIHLRKLLWVYCPGYAGVTGNDRADRLAGKATLTSGLLLGRPEALRSLRHCLRAQSQGHHTIDRLEERGVERGSGRRSSLKGRERAIVNQTLELFQRQHWGNF